MPRIRARSHIIRNNFSDLNRREQNLVANALRDITNKASTIIPEDQRNPVPYCLKVNIERVAEIASVYGWNARRALGTINRALSRAIDSYGIRDPGVLRQSFLTFYREFRENRPSLDNLGNRIELALQSYKV